VIGFREQGAHIRAYFPSFRVKYRAGELIAEGDVQPSPRGAKYRLRITYRVGDRPRAHVVSPKLVPREPAGPLPHVYPGERLCLYLPSSGEWSSKKSIALTIIPWAIEWLFHYELWHLTGEWSGGGVEPNGTKQD
jgi:hypothetical protein